VPRYARILRVLDPETHELLVDGALVNGDLDEGIALTELEHLEAQALAACETAALCGSFVS
jgi:hypothetical protein